MAETSVRTAMQDALKASMRDGDNARRDTLRMLLNAVKQVEIDTQTTATEEQVMDVIIKEAKRRRETLAEVDSGEQSGQIEPERAEALRTGEQAELQIIEAFLPQQLDADALRELVRAAIAETGAAGPKDMGKVMAALKNQVKGRADGKVVNDVVRAELNAQGA